MKVVAVILAIVGATYAGVIPATTLVRTPSLDSAIIQSDRLGGNFAYSSIEGHAYAAVSPVVQNVLSPVAVSYSATPVATPIGFYGGLVHPGAYLTAPQTIISPIGSSVFAPGLIATAPNQLVVPGVIPIEAAKEGEKPAEAPEAPEVPVLVAEPEPAVPAVEEPQADDSVSVESA